MPFGFKNESGTFQRATDEIYVTATWQTASIYFDNIVIFLTTPKENANNADECSRLCKIWVTLMFKKCRFVHNAIENLLPTIRLRRLRIALHTTDAIKQLAEPRNVIRLRLFLRLCIVFRRVFLSSTEYWRWPTVNFLMNNSRRLWL